MVTSAADGAPLPSAEVRLTHLTGEDADWEGAWYAEDWGPLERDTETTWTDSEGRFTFAPLAASKVGIVLWASHEDHEAASLVFEGSSDSWPELVSFLLSPAAVIEVSVLDERGAPAPGAHVEQFGLTPEASAKELGHVGSAQSRRHFSASRETGPDGRTRFGALPGEQVFIASLGDRCSVPWRGQRQQRVTLTVHPTFEVAGSVQMPSWEHLNYVGERRITIAAQQRNLWRTLHTIRSVDNGFFGPVSLPLVEADRYRVRLEGSPVIPAEALFDPPSPGARKTIDLATDIGVNVWFRVTDEDLEVIPEAVVKVSWPDPLNPDHWNFAERRCNESNQINVWSLPPGSMMFEAHADGYVPFQSGLTATSAYEGGYAPILLYKAGHLTGQCLQEGVPASDFEILVWPQIGARPSTTAFFDREDGRFELDTVPEGSFFVTASTMDSPGGDPQQVTCPPGGSVDVVLDLPRGLVGRGQVIDEASGEPIAGASVQMFVPASPAPIARWGEPFPTDNEGVFELSGFVRGLNFVRALAPGYSSKAVSKTPGADEDEIDFEGIALPRAQSFRILVERSDPAFGVTVAGAGTTPLTSRTFDRDGSVTYDGVSAGTYHLTFEDQNEDDTTVEIALNPGADWVLRERIQGANRLTVECRQPDGRPFSERFEAVASYISSQGHRHLRRTMTDTGLATIEGIDAASVSVRIHDNRTGAQIASSAGDFAGGLLHLVVPIDEDPFDLRVVDGEGEPLFGVRVMVLDPQNPASTVFGSTAENGACQLLGVPTRPVRVHLQHESGSHFGIAVDASTRSSELVLDPSGSIALVFQDEETPLKGVACVITDRGLKARLTNEATSDAAGRVVIQNLSPDEYPIEAWRSDCWPVEALVKAGEDPSPTTIQMRRLTDLEIEVVNTQGVLVSGVPIELSSVNFGTSVADWIAAGRVPPVHLATGPDGRIRVERVPHGEYDWILDLPDGQNLRGRLRAELSSHRPVLITLPD